MSTVARTPVSIERVESLTIEINQVHGRVTAKAYEYFVDRGCIHGHDVDDWLRAESDVIAKQPFKLSHEDHDLVVEMILPYVDMPGLEVRLTPHEMLITSGPDGTGRQIFRIVRFPVAIDLVGIDAEIAAEKLRVAAAIADQAKDRS